MIGSHQGSSNLEDKQEDQSTIDTKRKLSEDPNNQKQPKPKRSRKEKPQEEEEDPLTKDMPTQLSFKIENGIRYLAPYWSSYFARTKGRWIGRTIVDVFENEFLQYNPYYTVAAMRLGRVLINKRQMNKLDYRLKNNDIIEHIHHKHEHPVLDKPIKIISDSDDMLVVDKPSSMPVHACGQYRVNTVIGLLNKLHGITGLKLLHRLDRVTSGVLIFSKNLKTDIESKKLLQAGNLKKQYVCKSKGRFPDGKILCEKPIDILVRNLGIQRVRDDGKQCRSTFQLVWYNPRTDESLILCHIESGRTHQIRVHLQYLGYPIIDDNIYNSPAWGPERGKGCQYGKPIGQLIEDIKYEHSCIHWQKHKEPDYDTRLKEIAENEETQMEDWTHGDFKLDERPEIDPICLFCHIQKREAPPSYYSMPLHCWSYQSEKWAFTAELPDWAWPPPPEAEVIPGLIDDLNSSSSKILPILNH